MKNLFREKILKFGIICDSFVLEAWQATCIRETLSLNKVNLSLLILTNKRSSSKETERSRHKFISFINHKEDFSYWFKHIKTIYCKLDGNDNKSYFIPEEGIKTTKDQNLDFILSLSKQKIRSKSLSDCTRYGIWSFYHTDLNRHVTDPVGFWEIYNNEDTIGASLVKHSQVTNGYTILKEGFFKNQNDTYWKNRNYILNNSASWVKEVCEDILNNNASYFSKTLNKFNVPIYKRPNAIKYLVIFFKIILNKIKKITENLLFTTQWNIGYFNCSIDALLKQKADLRITWILSPSLKGFFSDPFGIKYNDKLYVFFEHYSNKKRKANISVIELDNIKFLGKIKTAIEQEHHVSYPCIFKDQNKIYMVLEEWKSKQLLL